MILKDFFFSYETDETHKNTKTAGVFFFVNETNYKMQKKNEKKIKKTL